MKKILKILCVLIVYQFMIYLVTPIKIGTYADIVKISLELFQNSIIILLITFTLLFFIVKKWSKNEKLFAYSALFMVVIYYYYTESLFKNIVELKILFIQ